MVNEEPTHAFVNYVKDNTRKIVPVCYVENFYPKNESDFDTKAVYTVMREVYTNGDQGSLDGGLFFDDSDPETDDLDLVEAEAVILKLGDSFDSLKLKISEKRIPVASKRYLDSPSKTPPIKVEADAESHSRNFKMIKSRLKTNEKTEPQKRPSTSKEKSVRVVAAKKEKMTPSEIEKLVRIANDREKRIKLLNEEKKELKDSNCKLVNEVKELESLNKSLQHDLIKKFKASEANSLMAKKVSRLESLLKGLQEDLHKAFKITESGSHLTKRNSDVKRLKENVKNVPEVKEDMKLGSLGLGKRRNPDDGKDLPTKRNLTVRKPIGFKIPKVTNSKTEKNAVSVAAEESEKKEDKDPKAESNDVPVKEVTEKKEDKEDKDPKAESNDVPVKDDPSDAEITRGDDYKNEKIDLEATEVSPVDDPLDRDVTTPVEDSTELGTRAESATPETCEQGYGDQSDEECDELNEMFVENDNKNEDNSSPLPDQSSDNDEELENGTETVQNLYDCKICGKKFLKKMSLGQHMRIHSNGKQKGKLPNKPIRNRKKKFRCPECGQMFLQAFHRNRHVQRVHNVGENLECEKCGKMFLHEKDLVKHSLNHSNESSTFDCCDCDKVFSTAEILKQHMSKVHVGSNPYQCDECGRKFNYRSKMIAHKLVHNVAKPFRCTKCCKAFGRIYHLHRHLTNSHGRVPKRGAENTCLGCKEPFTNSELLQEHIKMSENQE